MSYRLHPVREFLVRPTIPGPLERLPELARNLLWTWESTIRYMFRRLSSEAWDASSHNPVAMLSLIPREQLEQAAEDPRFLAVYRRACERLDWYLRGALPDPSGRLIAYFSMEYGLTECFRNYSGGLGILSGDTVKTASDMSLPFVGVGLLYQTGYFTQSLNSDGWQQEAYPTNDFYSLPVTPCLNPDGTELLVSVPLPGGDALAKVWQVEVGRVRIIYLDTNIDENTRPDRRDITDQLYGGDVHVRMRQEIVLGIGGLRALKALNLKPTVFHLNEGHSSFLQVERVRDLMAAEGLSFEEALESVRANSVFTTHTSVPAGIDVFDPGLLHEYFGEYCRAAGIDFNHLLRLGQMQDSHHPDRFLMPVLAMQTSSYRNGVSRLHQKVSQQMWQSLWPSLPAEEVPIMGITNGTHLLSWLNGDMANLYDQYLQPDWRDRMTDQKTWAGIADIPDHEIIEIQRRRKLRLINFVRQRTIQAARRRNQSGREIQLAAEVLDPNAFTIGFARRFATYKRATLILADRDRFMRLITDPDRPMQIIMSGKAHPKDEPGKRLIREIYQMSLDPVVGKRLVFLEDYGILVARYLLQGCDVWLNNPRRMEEACGTSGMKAAMNGVLNLSILDGWFDEAYEQSGGWSISDRHSTSSDVDQSDARAIYSLLENEIVPLYYDRPDGGAPREWMRRVKQSLSHVSYYFNCRRMMEEYDTYGYKPAHKEHMRLSAKGYAATRERAEWNSKVHQSWEHVRFLDLSANPSEPILSGSQLTIRAALNLNGLTPDDVKVEALIGRIGPRGELENTLVEKLPATGTHGPATIFERSILPHGSGRMGYALRVVPNHFDDPITRPTGELIKWSGA